MSTTTSMSMTMEQENKLLELRNQMLLDRMARDGVSLSEEDKK